MSAWRRLGLWLLLVFSLPAVAGSDGVNSFSASYQLLRGGIPLGRMELELALDDHDNYRYRAHSYPVGLAAVFRSDDIVELSEGRIVDGRPVPRRYHYLKTRKNKSREVTLDFHWEQQRVVNLSGGSRWSMELPAGAQDKFSQQLALMLALSAGQTSSEFLVADGGHIKTYRYSTLPGEEIKTGAGSFQTLQVQRQKEGKTSSARLWLAPELDYLPVKIEKTEDDSSFLLLLKSYRAGKVKAD